jgi:hypothetical protein
MRAILFIGIGSLVITTGLRAQTSSSSTKLTGDCSGGSIGGGPMCPPSHQVVIDLRRHGDGAPNDLNGVVSLGAAMAGVFRLIPQQAAPADSGIYGLIDVERDRDGQYSIKSSIGGVPAAIAQRCDAAATGRLRDLEFGAFLAVETGQLVRCVNDVRGKLGSQ